MNWSALTKKQQQMAIATAVVAVVQILLLAHLLGWTKPASARGGSAKDELRDLQDKLEDARTFIRREEMIRTGLAESVAKLEELTVYSPTRSDRYAWAYEYVSRCATLAGVELDSLEEVLFLADGKESENEPYEIRIAARCGYNRLVELLWRLERGNPLIRIKEVTMASMRDIPDFQQVQVILQWPASLKIEKGKEAAASQP